jgi:hypothetical protein
MAKEGYPRFWGALWAPLKGFYWFEGSAHNPIFEEPEPPREIMRTDVLGDQQSIMQVTVSNPRWGCQ